MMMMIMIFIIIGIKLAAEFINSQSKQLGEVDPLRLALQSKAHRDVIHVIDENGITIGLKKNPFYSSSSNNGSSNNVDNNNGVDGNGVDGIGGTRGSNSGVVIDFDNNDFDGRSKENGLKTKIVRIDRDVDDDHGDDIEDLMAIDDDDGGFISSELMSSSSDTKMNNNDKISNNRSKSQIRGRDSDGVVRRRGGGGGGKVETTTTAVVTVDFDSNGSSDAASDVDLISSHSNDSPIPPSSSSSFSSPLMTRDLELSLSSVPLSLLPIVPTLSISSSSSSSIPMTENPMLNSKTITSILSMRDHYNNDDDIIDGFYENLNRDNNHNSNDEVQREKKLFKSHYQHDVENLQLLMSQMTNQSSSSSLHHKNINPIRWIKDKASSALERKQQHHHHQQHQDNTSKAQRRKSFSGGDIGQYNDYDGGGGSSSSSGIGAKGNTKISSNNSGNRATRNRYTTRATTIINPDRTTTVIGREKTNGGGVDMDINNITIPAVKGSVRSNSTVNNQL